MSDVPVLVSVPRQEIILEDRHAGPAEVAACRLDFTAWLPSLPRRLRKIAALLATGESTGKVARRFKVSDGRMPLPESAGNNDA